ncbi:sterol desaturase family protein [Reyranella sp.]|uniref:sterol desaturase family protein n=1 Tax=Reyranella sp. TaxID=1929291 RepID=UPI003BABEBCE
MTGMQEIGTLYLVLLPVVMIAGLVEALWLQYRRGVAYDWKAWGCSLADLAGRRLLAFIPYTLAAPWLAWVWDHRLFTQSLDSVWSVLLLFVGLEFFYYWYHRVSHTSRWFWAAHSVHHSPNQFNLAAAYRLGWFGKFTGTSLFFTPLVLLGFTPTTVLTALFLNLLYQFWLHADWIPRLGWLEYVLNTPSSHRVHHARNPEYLDANYGGVLIVFDRLFGTYVAERKDLPCDYGLVAQPTSSRNPIALNVLPWIGLAKDVASARSPREAWMFLFGPPGWRPDGKGLTAAELKKRAAEAQPARPRRGQPQPIMG